MPDDPKPIADAASFDDTDEIRLLRPRAEAAPAGDSGGYDLEVDPFTPAAHSPPAELDPLPMTGQKRPKPRKPGDEAEVTPVAPPAPVKAPAPTSTPAPRPPRPKAAAPTPRAPTGDTSEFEMEVSSVDPVWSRWGEWGPDAIRVGLAGLGTLVLAWLLGGWSISLAFLALMLGGAATVLLSYPILITLERPVRITAEQAVTDFFAAASHHFPHYRRMWLLLSDLGREPGRFDGFEAFRDHWISQVEGWKRSAGAGKYTPLKFAVVDFRADKSTGKATSKAEYTVHVLVRGRVQEGPVASFPMAHGLVKGEDRMWYMNRGTLGPARR